MRLKYYVSFTLVFLLSIILKSQIINIEAKRFLNDTNGFKGRIDFNFTLIQNTNQIINFGNQVHLQYRHNKHRLLLINDLNLVQISNQDFVNSGYQHLRYNYKLAQLFTLESFLQNQYNPILKIKQRILAGLGVRIKMLDTPKAKFYFGSSYMYEQENNYPPDLTIQKNNRWSNYLSTSLTLSDKIEFVSTTFYQPLFNNINDYRIATDNVLDIEVTKKLSFKSGFNLLYDSKPAYSIPNLIYTFKNSLGWKF